MDNSITPIQDKHRAQGHGEGRIILGTVHEPHGASRNCFDMDELELEEQERDLGFHGGLGRLLHGFCACFVILLGQMGRTLEEKGKVMMGRLDL
ncbi:hypothetical protein Droror1_Dr00021529, partial [Drosera rotundifolia]